MSGKRSDRPDRDQGQIRGESMNLLDIRLQDLLLGFSGVLAILILCTLILWSIEWIINWKWWKKEYRQDFKYFRYFLEHREEIKKYIDERGK